MNTYSFAADLLIKYEGYNPTAVWDVNAYRIGHGSDTITDDNGNFRKVKKGDVTTKANARKDLERRLPEFEKKIIRQIGAEYWEPLNYKEIKEAIKTGNSEKIANAVINSTYNDNKSLSASVRQALRNRRKKEADIIRSAPNAKQLGINKKLLLIPLVIFATYYLIKKT
jgi:GH24 family phage-related lysozyme (muramidase)